jgi:hypothetical protein
MKYANSQTRKREPSRRHGVGPERPRCIGQRSSLYQSNILISAGAAGASVVLDNPCSRVSADEPQSRLFSYTRASDGGFQGAVVGALTVVSRPI